MRDPAAAESQWCEYEEGLPVASFVVDAVVLGSVYTLFALGLTLSWGVLGILNLAHGEVFVFGALGVYLLTQRVALPIWLLLPIAMLLGGLLSLALELLAFRPVRRRARDHRQAELGMIIASVGAGAALIVVAEDITGGAVGTFGREVFAVERLRIAGVEITNLEILIIAVSLVLAVGLAVFVSRSRHGRALRALAHDPYTTGLLGISGDRLAAITMFVAGALAGAAGVLLTIQLNAVEAGLGELLILKAFAVIILGGVGSVWGAIAGAYIVAAAEIATVALFSPSLREGVVFGLILVILLLRPQGLFSKGAWQRA